MTPAAQASAPPIIQVARMTRVDVDAGDAGERRILAHRAHRAADRLGVMKQVHGDDQQRGQRRANRSGRA